MPAAGSELICVSIGEHLYAIDIMQVREIRGWTASTPLPHAPPHVLGMINLRGSILPVIDLGSLLGGLLGGQGGAPANSQALGAAAGGIGVLHQILAQAGLGEQVDSWIGTGANQPVTPSALSDALGGTGALDSLAQSTGMSQEDVAAQLSEGLPELIDRLTPHGHVPAQE